ncbi:MAG: hypothetical protein IJ800_04290 [Clostridia bacterium]|nr:hypothetical protein [Clostridia bacterium]
MSKGKKIILAVSVILVASASFVAGLLVGRNYDEDLATLRFVIDSYKKYYLEESDDFVYVMSNSIIDRYSHYYTAEEYKTLQEVSVGKRLGIGVTFSLEKEGVCVYSVHGNSPADKAGVIKGGKVEGIKIAGKDEFVKTEDFSVLSSEMESAKDGEDFQLKISYDGEDRIFTVAKSEYRETYVFYTDSVGEYSFIETDGKLSFEKRKESPVADMDDKTAYLRYVSFNGLSNDEYGSERQIKTALEKFKEDGRSKLIVDLRSNGGGYMNLMESFASHLIDVKDGSSALVSKAVYKDGSEDRFYARNVDYGEYGFEKIIFLADENTASASEALIGATLDYDEKDIVSVVLARSTIGEEYVYKTYGKGIMQTTYERFTLSGTDAIRLTTAKIYWPTSSICIHGVGIREDTVKGKCFEAEYKEGDYVLDYALKNF